MPPQKVLSVRLHSKSHHKSPKCQNFLTGWYLEFFGGHQFWYFNFFPYLWILGGHQLKKTPCISNLSHSRQFCQRQRRQRSQPVLAFNKSCPVGFKNSIYALARTILTCWQTTVWPACVQRWPIGRGKGLCWRPGLLCLPPCLATLPACKTENSGCGKPGLYMYIF